MMHEFLQWWDSHPSAYWGIAVLSGLILFGFALQFAKANEADQGGKRSNRWIFPLLMLLVLIAWRWPAMLSADELNPDESQFIAGAITLRQDPVFWRSVDGMTAGPVVYYALMPWALVGLPLDYFTARVTGVLLIWLALVLVYWMIGRNHGETTARLGLLPGTIYISSVFSDDLNHYSSELAALPLLAGTLTLVVGKSGVRHSRRSLLLAGFLCGWLPWTKLQAAPIGATLILAGCYLLVRDQTRSSREKAWAIGILTGATLIPSALILPVIWQAGVWTDFYHRYIVQNLYYANAGESRQWFVTQYLNTTPTSLRFWLYIGTPLIAALFTLCAVRRPSRAFAISGLMLIAAIFCVLYPQRNFLHYTLLLLIPLVTWGAASLGEALRYFTPNPVKRLGILCLPMVIASALILLRLAGPPPSMIGSLAQHWRNPHTPLGSIIHLLSRPDDKLGVWGWHSQSYVESGLRQATRGAMSVWSILKHPQRDYYRQAYLKDFLKNQPAIFIDASGPYALMMVDRALHAHETFPALADQVRTLYRQVIDLGYARVFLRKDLWQSRTATPIHVQASLQKSRPLLRLLRQIPSESLQGFGGRRKWIGNVNALMMLPPYELSWSLLGNERVFHCIYSYDPQAYDQVAGNGTDFIIELLSPDGTRRLVNSFHLDPAHRRTDRGQHRLAVPLPPFEAGTRLTLRTAPGRDNNDAWDWAYIAQVKFQRSPALNYLQFPGYNRPPDNAYSPLSGFIEIQDQKILMLHAPAQLTYQLNGHEKRLGFTFGFSPADYANNVRTDGATFSVRARLPDASLQPLATQTLKPTENPQDRGKHRINLTLPKFAPGTQLEIIISPGDHNSFDWTYITNLQLH